MRLICMCDSSVVCMCDSSVICMCDSSVISENVAVYVI
jgi:hypothetical protein